MLGLDRLAEPRRERESLHRVVGVGREEHVPRLEPLGSVHRDVGVLQELHRIVRIPRVDADAHRTSGMELDVLEIEGRAHAVHASGHRADGGVRSMHR